MRLHMMRRLTQKTAGKPFDWIKRYVMRLRGCGIIEDDECEYFFNAYKLAGK